MNKKLYLIIISAAVVLFVGGLVLYKNFIKTNAQLSNAESLTLGQTSTQDSLVIKKNIKHYTNNFYEFDFLDTYTITSEKVYNSHEQKSGSVKDVFGMSFVDFTGPNGLKETVSSYNWLNTTPISPEKSVADAKNEFEKELHQYPSDTFEEINLNGLVGYRILRPFHESEGSSRLGSLTVGLYGKSYTYVLDISWAPTEIVSAEKFQKDAISFADIFVNTFKEKNTP